MRFPHPHSIASRTICVKNKLPTTKHIRLGVLHYSANTINTRLYEVSFAEDSHKRRARWWRMGLLILSVMFMERNANRMLIDGTCALKSESLLFIGHFKLLHKYYYV